MAFVPGFDHDVFISYAHGDDREWINLFQDRLRTSLNRLLPGADVWIDKDDLRKSPASIVRRSEVRRSIAPTDWRSAARASPCNPWVLCGRADSPADSVHSSAEQKQGSAPDTQKTKRWQRAAEDWLSEPAGSYFFVSRERLRCEPTDANVSLQGLLRALNRHSDNEMKPNKTK